MHKLCILKTFQDLSHYRTERHINATQIIMKKFTPICQRYTDVMAHRYFLEHMLFQETNNPIAIIQLTLVVIKLQVLANSLQTAQVCRYMHTELQCLKYALYMLISGGRRS